MNIKSNGKSRLNVLLGTYFSITYNTRVPRIRRHTLVYIYMRAVYSPAFHDPLAIQVPENFTLSSTFHAQRLIKLCAVRMEIPGRSAI